VRLWSVHPKYLDRQGLTAVWREALLAQAVLRGGTRGYRSHPQLERFRACGAPLSAIAAYLSHIHAEASRRGYDFDQNKIGRAAKKVRISVTRGQVRYEWGHLLKKLAARSPGIHEKWVGEAEPQPHPLFVVRPGRVESWEKNSGGNRRAGDL